MGESREEERATTEGINGKNGRNGKLNGQFLQFLTWPSFPSHERIQEHRLSKKFNAPNPRDAKSACDGVEPDSTKIDDE